MTFVAHKKHGEYVNLCVSTVAPEDVLSQPFHNDCLSASSPAPGSWGIRDAPSWALSGAEAAHVLTLLSYPHRWPFRITGITENDVQVSKTQIHIPKQWPQMGFILIFQYLKTAPKKRCKILISRNGRSAEYVSSFPNNNTEEANVHSKLKNFVLYF